MNEYAKNAHEYQFTRQGKIYDAIANEMLGLGEDTGGSIIQSPREGRGFLTRWCQMAPPPPAISLQIDEFFIGGRQREIRTSHPLWGFE